MNTETMLAKWAGAVTGLITYIFTPDLIQINMHEWALKTALELIKVGAAGAIGAAGGLAGKKYLFPLLDKLKTKFFTKKKKS